MWVPRAIAVATVALVVLAGSVPLASAGPVTDRSDAGGFDESVYREHTGDVLPMTLSVRPGSTATLRVEGPAYVAETTLVDADADGQVTVEFDTYDAGWRADEAAAFDALDADRLASTTRASERRSAPVAPGRYRLVLEGAERTSGAVLLLSAPSFHLARAHAVPADARPGSLADLRALSSTAAPVAVGDWTVLAFRADGLSGLARVDEPPTANLVRAADPEAGAPSRHTVSHELRRPVANLSAVSVDYDAGDEGVPGGLARASNVTVGVDTDDDGRIERDLTDRVTRTTVPRNATLRVEFADGPDVDAGETLLVGYRLRNPAVDGSDAVALWLDNRMVDRGHVEYGLDARGALGNDLDLTLEAVVGEETWPVPLPAHEFVIDRERDTLYVVLDTGGLGDEPVVTYRGTLRLGTANPYVATPRTLTTRFELADRRASLARLDGTSGSAFSTGVERLRVETTLAPGTELTVRTTARGDPAFLAVTGVTVDENRSAVVELRVPDRLRGRTLTVTLREDEARLGSPLVGRVA